MKGDHQDYGHDVVATQSNTSSVDRTRRRLSFWHAAGILLLLLLPTLAAVWATPWFFTQDGPAHVYNAQILLYSFDANSPFRDDFRVVWQPIPNLSGHLMLMGLLRVIPAWAADRVMTTITLVGFGLSILWLRSCVNGNQGLIVAAMYAALLSMNYCWLFGFANFMLGACVYPVALGIWWHDRNQLTPGRIFRLATLLVAGFFCHLVPVLLSVISLQILAIGAPISEQQPFRSSMARRLGRLAKTTIAFIPVVVLFVIYSRITTRGGPMVPTWDFLSDPLSVGSWKTRLEWVDPITLSARDGLPFTFRTGRKYFLLAPVIWLIAAAVIWIGACAHTVGRSAIKRLAKSSVDGDKTKWTRNDRSGGRGWLFVSSLLLFSGLITPDSLGPNHGSFMAQRVVLIGLTTLVCVPNLGRSTWAGRAATGALALTVPLQSILVWDYAIASSRTAGQIAEANQAVGHNQRVACLLISTPTRFRMNPMSHADMWLGIDNGNILWNNYEAEHYYFPVQFVNDEKRPGPEAFYKLMDEQSESQKELRLQLWNKMLTQYGEIIDVLVVWKRDQDLDAVTSRDFLCVEDRGDVRVFHRRTRKGAR